MESANSSSIGSASASGGTPHIHIDTADLARVGPNTSVYLIRGGFDAMRNNPNVCPDVERSFEATMATVLNTLGGMFPESTVRLSLIRKMSCRHTAPADNAPEKSEMN